MKLRIYAENFRGFKLLDFDVDDVMFLVGDNSSGKTSILYLMDYLLNTELSSSPVLATPGVGGYDYFSPYFDFADVIIGYKYGEGEGAEFKLITLQKTPKDSAITSRVTLAKNGYAFTIKLAGKRVMWRLLPFSNTEVSQLAELHRDSTGFTTAKDYGEQRGLNSEDSVIRAALAAMGDKPGDEKIMNTVSLSTLPHSRFIAALRAEPALYYPQDRRFQKRGEHFAAMANDIRTILKKEDRLAALEILKEFGNEGALFDDINFHAYKKRGANSPIFVDVFRSGQVLGLSQLGFGLSQILPVIMELIFSRYFSADDVLSIQQPELHLHPKAQAAFGQLLAKIASENERIIVETHSDFIIERFRACRKTMSKQPSASVMFCRRTDGGNACAKILIAPDGNLINPPEDYREFFLMELAKTL